MLAVNTINYYSSIKLELEKIHKIISFLEENNPIQEKQKILTKFLTSEKSLNGAFAVYSIKKDNASDSEVLILNYMNKFDKFKREFDILEFFGIVATIKATVNGIFEEYNHIDESITNLLLHLEELATLYQNVIRSNDSKQDIVVFFDRTQECTAEYNSIIKSLKCHIETITSNYDVDKVSDDNCMELQLLDVEYSVGEFGTLLTNIDNAYSSISSLYGAKTSFKSLKIVKIESGSLLSKILGDENILEVMALMLRRLSDYIHQTFTRSGKVELNATIMKEISNDAEIIDKLEKSGIKVTKAKQNIENALNAATNELYEIASNAPRIKINNEQINIIDTTIYLDYKMKLLENNNENTEKEMKD